MPDTPTGSLLEMAYVLRADRERVFDLFTEPADLPLWWGPRGFSTPVVELDLRIGGRYRFSMQPPEGDLFHLTGEFLDVVRPGRLVYTFCWEEPTPDDRETVVTITLDQLSAGTKVSLSHVGFATEERLALHRDGWTDSFERLDEVLAVPHQEDAPPSPRS